MRRGENGPRCKVEMTDSCGMSPEVIRLLSSETYTEEGMEGILLQADSGGSLTRLRYLATAECL